MNRQPRCRASVAPPAGRPPQEEEGILLDTPPPPHLPDLTLAGGGADLARALARAAAALARLDQALGGRNRGAHPLRPAFLHRTRLEAVRRQAIADGQVIDPWHLAAVLAGLRPRVDAAAPRVMDRGAVLAAARHALDFYGWLAEPDFDQEGEVQRAAAALAAAPGATPLLAAASGARAWLDRGGARPPLRAALVQHWTRHGLLPAPVPLAGTAALRGGSGDDGGASWAPRFLDAVAGEAEAALELLLGMERAWLAARAKAAEGRRRTSRAAAAVDLLAAAPLVSATSLAAGLGMAVKNATALLDQLRAAGIAVEVTHRAKRRLFGLAGLAPLRDEIAPPRRPVPGRGRGRPSQRAAATDAPAVPAPEPPTITPLAPWSYDYGELDRAMAAVDAMLRRARRDLGQPATRSGAGGAADA